MMEKYLLVIVCVLLLFMAGCTKNQIKCSGNQTDAGISFKSDIAALFDKDNKLQDVMVIYDFGNKKTTNQYCSIFKLMENADKGISVNCLGSKIIIKGFAKIDSFRGKNELLGITKEEFKKTMEKANFTCK